MRKSILLLFLLVSLTALALDDNHQHAGKPPEKLGTVNFPTSCSAKAQPDFLRGLALLHSFWYPEAEKSFRAAAAKDDKCAIAWWGVASSLYHPLWERPSANVLKQGAEATAAAQRALAKAPKTSDRERGYIAAITAFYSNPSDASRAYRDRALAWSQGMERVHQLNPQDDEATIFYALSLLATEKPGDRERPNHRAAGALLEPVFQRLPDHPGVAHYLIHSYDSPELAPLGVPAARRYAQIAPSASHALHMPSHIFERLGLWQDSINSNIAASDAARDHRKDLGPKSGVGDEIHALDFLSYAYEQTGQDAKALAAVERAEKLAAASGEEHAYAEEVRATYNLERRDWKAAETSATGDYPWAEAFGAARAGDVAAARAALAGMEKSRDNNPERKASANSLDVETMQIKAWLAHAEGNNEEALRLMQTAAEKQDAMPEPGRTPARAQLGDLLMELNHPAEALAAYEASLRKAPNRFNTLYGAASAAQLADQQEAARKYYAQFAELCRDADSDRPEIKQARTFLAQR